MRNKLVAALCAALIVMSCSRVEHVDVLVVGGGASGMMASIFASRNGFKTLVLDHNEKLGKKLYITGKGKCNLTNNSSIENHLNHIVTNSKFMYSALNAFSPQDTMEFFEDNGLKLRTERGNRVFPNSDKSSDVIKTLEKTMQAYGVVVSLNNEIVEVKKDKDIFTILCNNKIKYTTNRLIIATGGVSYSGTGATGLTNAFSATGMLIIVSVALEFNKQLEAQVMMKNYRGFLK